MNSDRDRILQVLLLLAIAGGTMFFLMLPAAATLKYKKDTDKNCTFCHTGIPRRGDEDPQLTEDGKQFKENGYQLTEEQKRRNSAGVVLDRPRQ
ncbi:MAG: hypothetical protein HY315_01185 [Acidobacteria bacterium]|nr:hypothetical protein [Acidobacteriota bacterium]